MGADEAIADALRPTVRAAGLDIWDVERSGTSVMLLVDRPGGVDLDAIAGLAKAVSAVLDDRDDLVPAGRYTLEVSSPGLERRLRYPRHFAAYVGQEVAVKTSEAVDGARRLRGSLVGATDADITLQVHAESGEAREVRLPLSLVERANTVFVWGSTARPGPGKGGRSPSARRSQGRRGLTQDRPAAAPHKATPKEEAR